MGQYHTIANFDKKEYLKINGGSKLMEFSWQNCSTSLAFENLLKTDWKNDYVLVVGDYARIEDARVDNPRGYFALKELYQKYDYLKNIEDIYDYVQENFKETSIEVDKNNYSSRYIINEETNEYIDLKNENIQTFYYDKENNKLVSRRINPLFLMLAISNGLGGGDYYGRSDEYIGYWTENPQRFSFTDIKPKGYKELDVHFDEEREIYKSSMDEYILEEELIKDYKKYDNFNIDEVKIRDNFLTDKIAEIKENVRKDLKLC